MGGDAVPYAHQPVPHQQTMTNHHTANRVYNSHSSYPIKAKHANNGTMMAVNYVSPTMIASAPPVVSDPSARIAVPSSGAITERIPRLISGRTDWAAKYLKTSTKYSK